MQIYNLAEKFYLAHGLASCTRAYSQRVEVKLSLYLIKRCAMKTHGGEEVYLHNS
jgi:hypothetical protein